MKIVIKKIKMNIEPKSIFIYRSIFLVQALMETILMWPEGKDKLQFQGARIQDCM